jgi:hypothetical protein
MEDVQIRLSALWVALMLTYLLGDVLRIFSGDFKPGEIGGVSNIDGDSDERHAVHVRGCRSTELVI